MRRVPQYGLQDCGVPGIADGHVRESKRCRRAHAQGLGNGGAEVRQVLPVTVGGFAMDPHDGHKLFMDLLLDL